MTDTPMLESYLSFLQDETIKHREYVHYFYDHILWGIGIVISLFAAVGVYLQWLYRKDIKHKIGTHTNPCVLMSSL